MHKTTRSRRSRAAGKKLTGLPNVKSLLSISSIGSVGSIMSIGSAGAILRIGGKEDKADEP